jgi:hypothetical protein
MSCSLSIPPRVGFFENGHYQLRTRWRSTDAQEMVALYAEWIRRHPILVLEGGLAEDDSAGWKMILNRELGDKIELVGDDLFVTNITRIARGIAESAANAVLIKLKQIGTLTETIAAVHLAYDAGWGAMGVSPTAAGRPWIRSSQISPKRSGRATLKPARRAAANGSRNVISCFGSRNNLDNPRLANTSF